MGYLRVLWLLTSKIHRQPPVATDFILVFWASYISYAGPLGQLLLYCWPKDQLSFTKSQIMPLKMGYFYVFPAKPG